MPLERASSNSGNVSGLGIWASKYLSTSAWSSIHQRGKKVVSASSGNTTNFEPRESASFSISIMRFTTLARLSARWMGPSWADETFRRRDTSRSPLEQRLEAKARHRLQLGRGDALGLGRIGRIAGQELAGAAHGVELAVLDDDATAAHHDDRPAGDLAAFVGRVADIVVQVLPTDGDVLVGIPDREVGVRADGDRALARIEAVEPCVVGRGQRHELL